MSLPLVVAIQKALGEAPGHPALVDDALRAVFSFQLHAPQLTDDPRARAAPHAVLHEMLTHLAAGPWHARFVALELNSVQHEALVIAGFAAASLPEVEWLIKQNWRVTEGLLAARDDAPEALLALAERLRGKPAENPALLTALGRLAVIADGLEDALTLANCSLAATAERAFTALGPTRTARVVERVLARFDHTPEFRSQSLIPMLERVGPWLNARALDAVLTRAELLSNTYLAWEDWGQRLGQNADTRFVLGAVAARIAQHDDPGLRDGWRRAARMLLDRATHRGFVPSPDDDVFIDPAGAARGNDDVWMATRRLLNAIGPTRAEAVLTAAFAGYRAPCEAVRFAVSGMSPGYLSRVAEAMVAVRDDPAFSDLLAISDLKPFGPGFVDALIEALRDLRPRRAFVKHLERNLSVGDYNRLSIWLETRPPPKRPRAP